MREPAHPQAVAIAAPANGDGARVIAKGYGDLAEQVIAEARRHGIYVHQSPELVALLMKLDLDERIPARLYDVIAELLAWVAELDATAREGTPAAGE
ncbi:MAG TPA: EscU/YscU/HrcU family type III secretion system export apparatus switch protein [Rhodanobacteraceae bacterium]|nr:EscU/YscU/HrcU family type III secretion system export apparatus switch protein [Rhodanobacteraceae bacterium]